MKKHTMSYVLYAICACIVSVKLINTAFKQKAFLYFLLGIPFLIFAVLYIRFAYREYIKDFYLSDPKSKKESLPKYLKESPGKFKIREVYTRILDVLGFILVIYVFISSDFGS